IDADATSLWIIDKTARVQRIDPKTGNCLLWWRMPEYQLGKPVGVSVVSMSGQSAAGGGGPGTGLLFIPDTPYNRTMVYQPPARAGEEPTLVRQIGSFGREPGQFIYPTDVAVLKSAAAGDKPGSGGIERIYVSEYGGNDRVSVFDADWHFLFSFGAF